MNSSIPRVPVDSEEVRPTMGLQASVNGLEPKPEARVEEREILDAISRAILNHAGLKPLIDHLLRTILPVGPFDAGWVRLLEPGSDTTTLAGSIGTVSSQRDTEKTRRVPLLAVAREVMKSGHRARVIDDVQSFPGLRTAKNAGLQAAVFLPISEADEVLGCLVLGSRSPLKLSPNRVRLLETIANHVGIAVKKTRLFEETTRNLERLRALHEINLAVTSTLDLESVLDALLAKIDESLPFPIVATVRMLNEDGQRTELLARRNITADRSKKSVPSGAPGLRQLTIEQMAPLAVLNVQKDPRTRYLDFFRDNGLVSYLGLPLIAKGKCLGTIAVYTKEEHRFTGEEIDFLSAVATVGATAIHNSRLYREAEAAKDKEQALNRQLADLLSQITGFYSALAPLEASKNPDQMLESMTERLTAVAGADGVSIRMFDDTAHSFVCVAHRGFPPNLVEAVQEARQGRKSEATYRTGEPLFIADIATDTQAKQKKHLDSGFHSSAYLPFKVKGVVKGVIHLVSRTVGFFSEEKREHLAALSRLVEIVFENRKLFEETDRRVRELAAVHAVTSAVSGSLDLEQILLKGLDAVLEVTEMDAGYVQFIAGDPPELVIKAYRGMSPAFIASFSGNIRPGGKTEQVTATKKTLVLENMLPEERGRFQSEEIVTAAWVPIASRGKVIGVLTIVSRTKRTFPKEQLPLLDSIGNALSVALENARLFEETERRLKRTRALHEINLAVTSTLDLKSVLDTLLEKIDQALPFPIVATARVFDKETGTGGLLAYRNITAERCPRITADGARGLSAIALERKAPVTILNALKDPRTRHPEFFTDNGLVSYLGMPLIAEGQTLGTIVVFTKEERKFSSEEIEFLSAVASLGATAIYNSRLYREAEAAKEKETAANRQLSELLNQTTALYSALAPLEAAENPHRMLEGVMDRLLAATGADAASVRTFDEATQTFAWMAHRGVPLDYLSAISTSEPGGKVRTTYNTGEPLFIADISADPRARRKRQVKVGFCSSAYLPLKVRGVVKGVLYLASRTAGFFSEEKRERLAVLSRLMEIVFENRELFDEAGRRARELAAVHTVTAAVSGSLDLEQILLKGLDAVLEVTGMEAGYIRLLAGDPPGLVIKAHRGMSASFIASFRGEMRPGGKTEQIIATKKPLVFEDIPPDHRGKFQGEGITAAAWLPIMSKETAIGILAIASRIKRTFPQDQLPLLASIGNALSVALENARLYNETKFNLERIGALHEASLRVLNSLDLKVVVESIFQQAFSLGSFDIGVVRLLDPRTKLLEPVGMRGYRNAEAARHRTIDLSDPESSNLHHQVVFNNESLAVEEVSTVPGLRTFKQEGVQSALLLPIWAGQKVVGGLQLGSRTRRRFPPELVRILEALTHQMGVAIQKAQLHEETTRNLQHIGALHEINLAVTSTLDLKSVLDTLLEKIEQALSFPIVAVIRMSSYREGPTKGVLACRNIPVEQCLRTVTSDARGIGAIALEQGAPVAIPNALKDPRTQSRSFFRDNGLVSYLSLPLIAKGEALGTIGIFTKEEREFSREEIEFLFAVASLGATAIYNSQLYQATETAKDKEIAANRQLSDLLDQTTALYSALAPLQASENPHRMFESVMDRLVAATGADAASVRTFDETTQTFVWMAHRGFPLDYLSAISPTEPGRKVLTTYNTGEPLFIADISTDPRAGRKRQVPLGFRSSAYLPLKVRGVVKGVLYLASRTVGFFSEEKRGHLAALSRLMEIVFENRELFDEVIAANESLEKANERHRMRAIQQAALNHFSHLALSSKAIPSLLEEAVLHISQILRVDYCGVLELLPGGGGLILRAGAGWQEDCVGQSTVSSQWDSEAGYTLLSNEPVIIPDLREESRFTASRLLREHGVVSGVTVIIEGQERPFGVIGAFTTSRRNFTDEEIHFLLSFAYVLATAVERAQAEHKLRESQHKYEGLIESIDGIVFEADAQTFHCTFVSRQGERILGYPVEQWLKEPSFWLAHLHPDDREWAPAYVKKRTEEMRPHDLEFRMIAADGKVVWLRALVTVIAEQGRSATLRGICVDITERKRMEMEVSEISERERQKIGRDLHDELGQLLTGIACIGASLTQRLEAKSAPEAATAGQITTLTNQAIHQTRALARGLYPVELQTNGLASALKELASAAEGMFGISCRLECDPQLSIPEDDVAIHLYRIAQEAIDNAVRHGKARHVRIGVENQNGRGILSVVDDGIGFSKAPPGYKGMGLRIMKSRAELIKGGLEVRKGDSGGTVVECSFRRSLEGGHPAYV